MAEQKSGQTLIHLSIPLPPTQSSLRHKQGPNAGLRHISSPSYSPATPSYPLTRFYSRSGQRMRQSCATVTMHVVAQVSARRPCAVVLRLNQAMGFRKVPVAVVAAYAGHGSAAGQSLEPWKLRYFVSTCSLQKKKCVLFDANSVIAVQ